LSFSLSSRNEPSPEPVPPAIECINIKPCGGGKKKKHVDTATVIERTRCGVGGKRLNY
jgi:hypothetical protein